MTLGEASYINPRLTERLSDDTAIAFVPMAAVSAEEACVVAPAERPYSEVKKGYTCFESGDVLVAKITPCFENGKIAQANLPHKVGFGSTEFHVVRPKHGVSDGRYLHHYLRQAHIRSAGERRMTGSGGQRRVPESYLASLPLRLPPIAEQRRIAAILDQVAALRAWRRQALVELDKLAQAVFLEMFGDPIANPKDWPTQRLTEVCHTYSGGTPSKTNASFWKGSVPWFSAKDMKAYDLFDSQDHISETVLQKTSLKLLIPNTVAIVVRGMILAHTFPVCVLRVAATINQDLKALIPKVPIDAQFLANCLRAQAGAVLERVSEAGHGTKRLDAEGLQQISIILPPPKTQADFAKRVKAIEALQTTHRAALAESDALFASLQDRAFTGTL
jgi:type I restriction enzyme S subunit